MLTAKARAIADNAEIRKLWIYSPSNKRWYSPEEFRTVFTYIDPKDDFLNQVQLRHPMDGIQAGFKKLEDLQLRLSLFAKSVLEYYKKS